MAERALTWQRAASIGWRDLKSAPGKFAFVVLSVAVGVAALVGVRGFSESFRTTLMTEARSLMAGDLSARVFRQPNADELQKLANLEKGIPGSDLTWVTETISMASVPPDPVPILVTLKGVDPTRYPFYGSAQLEPAISLRQALDGELRGGCGGVPDSLERACRRQRCAWAARTSGLQPYSRRSRTASRPVQAWDRG